MLFRNDLNIVFIIRVCEDGLIYKLYFVERLNFVIFFVIFGVVEGVLFDVKFSDVGNFIVVRGDSIDSGIVVCILSWDDDLINNGIVFGKISIFVIEVDINSVFIIWI